MTLSSGLELSVPPRLLKCKAAYGRSLAAETGAENLFGDLLAADLGSRFSGEIIEVVKKRTDRNAAGHAAGPDFS